ncbi:MAG: TonB-dependent receptor [Alphaproteobacteria bacterium]|nr:TonB-dependent receptor [Alphaproteobacteria bacterium]
MPMMIGAAHAQQAARADTIIVTGTRVEDRSVLDTAVAVDVVGAAQLENLGISEINQALSVNLPSFNFPRPALSDGTDTVRPAALRGLAPDQTLVLLNSKRRHSAALVNLNGTIGRGSTGVDLNTIPTAAVSAVEVLRDGASAQYGSDAIAGVINVRLKEASSGGGVSATYGWRPSTYEFPTNPPPAGLPIAAVPAVVEREVEDGELLTVQGWKGFAWGETGFVTVSGEYKQQEHTERSGFDTRQVYPRLTSGAFDPREATFNRFNAWTGEPEIDQYTLFANAGYDLANGVELYGWGSYQYRDALSAGFYRLALDVRNTPQIYPDGFLPKINPEVSDGSAAGGARFALGDWDMDASLVYGSNLMEFTIRDTLNRSIGPTSKTTFDAGGFQYQQLVANISGVNTYDVGLASPLNVAAGVEMREEMYEIFAGEPDSYRNGGALLPFNTSGCMAPFSNAVIIAGGCPTASGAQVFAGFRPANEVDEDRFAVGAFIDIEANLTEALLVSAAVRGETYSDFGETVTGKLAARYDFTDAFALRASVQNGFRAPSLQQQFFSTTSTNFILGVPFDITTFPVTDPVAIALGAQPLDAEKSLNYSVGGVLQLGGLSVTVDAYRIDVEDRIVLSENLTASNVQTFLAAQGFIGAGGGRFFINGVDTETQGVDIIASYSFPEWAVGQFDLTLGANFSETDVTAVPAIPVLTALSPSPTLFSRINVLTFEQGSPADKFTGALDWELGPFSATARAIRYGEVLVPEAVAANDQTLSEATLLDLEGRWAINDTFSVAVGADNVFDEYPDATFARLNGTGNRAYSTYSPFGSSGRFVYGKINLSF